MCLCRISTNMLGMSLSQIYVTYLVLVSTVYMWRHIHVYYKYVVCCSSVL